MKKIGLIICLLIGHFALKASTGKDTTVVEFTEKGSKKRISVITIGNKDFRIPASLNLNNLLMEIGVDSNQRKKAVVLVRQNGDKQDTILVVSRDGRKVKIMTNNPRDIFRSTSKSDTIRNAKQPHNDENMENDTSIVLSPNPKNNRFFRRNDFNIYLGLNNWHSTNAAFTEPSLSPLGSRYFAISWQKNFTLVHGKKADLAISYAPEILWYNFMFDNNKFISVDNNNQVQFMNHPERLSKSKLVVPTLNLPVMLHVGLKESRFMFSFGGYVGYRIDSYTKLKFASSGNKDHLHQSYNLNDVRYGLAAEIGRKSGLKIFFRYDLNPLFKSTQKDASNLQGWSIGLIIL